MLRAAGARIGFDLPGQAGQLGRARTATVRRALELPAEHMLFCEFDRLLTWAERHPEELATVTHAITARDCTVLGRTAAAFATHPRVQRETEAIVNDVFALVSGRQWDITAAARGLSRRAAATIGSGYPRELGVGTDAAWPLLLLATGGFDTGYVACDGLEFESADRFADQVAAAGGVEAWKTRLDGDPRRWADRVGLVRQQLAAMRSSLHRQRPDDRDRAGGNPPRPGCDLGRTCDGIDQDDGRPCA
jgi:hypothetical protein